MLLKDGDNDENVDADFILNYIFDYIIFSTSSKSKWVLDVHTSLSRSEPGEDNSCSRKPWRGLMRQQPGDQWDNKRGITWLRRQPARHGDMARRMGRILASYEYSLPYLTSRRRAVICSHGLALTGKSAAVMTEMWLVSSWRRGVAQKSSLFILRCGGLPCPLNSLNHVLLNSLCSTCFHVNVVKPEKKKLRDWPWSMNIH